MSLQQVNLYQDELKTLKLKFSAATLVQLSAMLLVICSIIAGIRYVQLQQQQSALVEVQQNKNIAMAELQKIQAELSTRKKDEDLAKKIIDRTKELANKQNVYNILSQDEFGNTDGFIEYVSGLARQRVDGLWLTKIRISSGGSDIALHGTTSKPALLPKYLQRLSDEKAFSGTEFQNLLMARKEKKSQWLDFSLQNKKDNEVNPQ